jgi:hypothetical protein
MFDCTSVNILQEIFMQFQLLYLTKPLSTYYKRSLCSFLNYCLTEPLSTYYNRSLCSFPNCYVWLNLFQHITRDLYAIFPTVMFDWTSVKILQQIFMHFQLLYLTKPLSTYYKTSSCSFPKCYVWLNLCKHITRDLHALSTVMFDLTSFNILQEIFMQFCQLLCLTEPLSIYYNRSLHSFSCYVWLNLFQHITRDLHAVFPTVMFHWTSVNILQEIFT